MTRMPGKLTRLQWNMRYFMPEHDHQFDNHHILLYIAILNFAIILVCRWKWHDLNLHHNKQYLVLSLTYLDYIRTCSKPHKVSSWMFVLSHITPFSYSTDLYVIRSDLAKKVLSNLYVWVAAVLIIWGHL